MRILVPIVVALGGCSLYFSDDDPPPDAPWVVLCDGGLATAHCSPPIDAPDAPIGVCNPIAPPGSQGCDPGMKCTSVTLQEEPVPVGHLACVPDGTVATGGACLHGPVGEHTGFDNCAAGNVCIGGECHDICSFDGDPAGACAPGFHCSGHANLFGNSDDDPLYGACAPQCDPVTQTLPDGDRCGPGQGCYVLTSTTTTISVCAHAGSIAHDQPITGTPFANSCLPGHQPRRASQVDNTFECGALCRPAEVTSTTNLASEGGVAPFTCEARGAEPPASANAGESCRYWWAREPFDDLSMFSNTVGWCFEHSTWQYDSNGDMVVDAPFPRCTTLTHGDVVPPVGNPAHDDAVFFWCAPRSAALQGPLVSTPAPVARLDRLGGWR